MEMFINYPWPGNLREFRNVVRRAVLLTPSGKVEASTLPWEITQQQYLINEVQDNQTTNTNHQSPSGGDLKSAAAKAEYETIMQVLREVNFNKTKAAEKLNIDRKTLYNKMKAFKDLS
jgi:two-component system response regulator HydG